MTSTVRQIQAHTVAQARLAAYGLVHPLPVEIVGLARALGRYLAEPVLAHTDLPGVPTAAMDGWAVSDQGPWRVLPDRRLAGPPRQRMPAGSALRISAGDPLPRGAAGVLRRDDGQLADGVLYGALRSGRDLRPRDADWHGGELLVDAGAQVTPPVIGLAAAGGYQELCVARLPRVCLATLAGGPAHGNRRPARRPKDSFGPQLPTWVPLLGGAVTTTRQVSDNLADTVAALCTSSDIIVAAEGAAASLGAGPASHLRDALGVLGAETVIDGVAVHPGHSMLLARRPDGVAIVGLSGHTLAAAAGVLTVLEPLLARLAGRALPRLRTAVMADGDIGARSGPDSPGRLVPVAIDDNGFATVISDAGPGMLRSLAAADALALLPSDDARSGVRVAVLNLPWSSPGSSGT